MESKTNEWEWIQVVSDLYSTRNYYQYQNERFEHYFTIDYDKDRPIKLLRIDIADKFYLKEFKLIYLETGETIQGHTVEDSFTFQFLWLPRKGKYKIESRGGKYRYSVFMLESSLKFTAEPICVVKSPFNILVSCKMKDKALYKLVTFRKVGTTEWRVAEPSVKKVSLDVDPTAAYEIKMKLVIPNMYETEYSPIVVISNHQSWANQFEIDPDFFNTTLLYKIKIGTWLDNVSYCLRYKVHSENRWIECVPEDDDLQNILLTKNYPPFEVDCEVASRLYDSLVKDDATLDWQLVFKNTKTGQVVESKVRTVHLQKRQKIARGETSFNYLTKFYGKNGGSLYLCGDGQFWYQQLDFNLKGNFMLERKDPKDRHGVITLIPKFKKFEQNNIELDQLSLNLSPEVVKIILSYVASPPENQLKPAFSINLVCKHWFNIFADGLLRKTGLYLIGEKRDHMDFSSWDSYPTDRYTFSGYSTLLKNSHQPTFSVLKARL